MISDHRIGELLELVGQHHQHARCTLAGEDRDDLTDALQELQRGRELRASRARGETIHGETFADWWSGLYLHAAMPPWPWYTVRAHCRTCDQVVWDELNGVRWPYWDRETLRELGAQEIHGHGGAITLALPIGAIVSPARGVGCLLHEIRPEWDGRLIGRSYTAQDLRDFPMHPLRERSHSTDREKYIDVEMWRHIRPLRREDCL